jgi:hypothetical protein
MFGVGFAQLYGNGQQYHNVGQLTNAIQAAWNTITQGYLDSLFIVVFSINLHNLTFPTFDRF